MAEKLSIRDLDLKGKKVLIRVDFNVPLEKGQIIDDSRIRASLPTIQYALAQGGALILMSHLGRPKGKIDQQFTLKPCAEHLSALLKRPVEMAPDCQGLEVKKMASALKAGDILLLENLRFHVGEEHPEEEPAFVSHLAALGDIYINDAFGTAHRPHASTTLLAQCFPGKAAAGFLMDKEIAYLGATLIQPRRPFYAILGGAKISTKFKMIEILMQKADALLIGGAMAYTFFKAEGIATGHSLVEDDFLSVARELMDISMQSHCRLMLPIDLVVTREIKSQAESYVIRVKEGIPQGFEGVDIGPETIQLYSQFIQDGATIFWNGPLGVFECPPFNQGTNAMAKALANLQSATTIVGGGDSIAALERTGVADHITHISTGGGAALEYIEFGHLPGIEALSNKPSAS